MVGFVTFIGSGAVLIGLLMLLRLVDGFRLQLGEVKLGFLLRLVNKEVELSLVLRFLLER